jgi:hypothetical protein
LPQVGLERADAARLEGFETLERLQQRVLHQIVGVGETARPLRQPPRGPALERAEMAGEQPLQRRVIAVAGFFDQLERRFEVGAHESRESVAKLSRMPNQSGRPDLRFTRLNSASLVSAFHR